VRDSKLRRHFFRRSFAVRDAPNDEKDAHGGHEGTEHGDKGDLNLHPFVL